MLTATVQDGRPAGSTGPIRRGAEYFPFAISRRPLSGEILLISPVRELGGTSTIHLAVAAESISAALTACGAGHCACKSGSGIRSPSRSKPAPVSATAKAPPHQTASGEVASSAPPTAGPRATPAVKERP